MISKVGVYDSKSRDLALNQLHRAVLRDDIAMWIVGACGGSSVALLALGLLVATLAFVDGQTSTGWFALLVSGTALGVLACSVWYLKERRFR